MIHHDFELLIETDFGEILLNNEHKIMAVVYKESCFIDLEMARQISETVYPFIKKYAVDLFISDNTANFITSTPEARTYLSNNKSLQLMKAHAVIVKDLPIKILVNSFIKHNKPIVPFMSCKSYEKALEWLQTYQEVNSSNVPSM